MVPSKANATEVLRERDRATRGLSCRVAPAMSRHFVGVLKMSKFSASDSKTTLYCSFCGKSQNEVRKLIAGPTVFICDECVELCMDIIREENKSSLTKSRDGIPTPKEIRTVL